MRTKWNQWNTFPLKLTKLAYNNSLTYIELKPNNTTIYMKAVKKPQLNISIAFSATETLFFFCPNLWWASWSTVGQTPQDRRTDGLTIAIKIVGEQKVNCLVNKTSVLNTRCYNNFSFADGTIWLGLSVCLSICGSSSIAFWVVAP